MNTLNLTDRYLSNSATQGNKDAQYVMGIKYLFGDGVEENIKQGTKWLKEAANKRHKDAQFLLGQLFQTGYKTLQPNKEQAIRWYRLAAQQKHTEAQQILQQLEGTPKPEASKPSQKPLPKKKVFDQQKIANDELIKACLKGDIAQVSKALKKGADVNIKDQEDYTPLHHAARFGRTDIVYALLQQKADVNAKDGDGNTAADLALKNTHTEIVQMIKRYGGKK